jgi:hypothetical protein
VNEGQATEVVERAVERYFSEPQMGGKCSEWAIAHRVAVHLEDILREEGLLPPGVSVDCEYNRDGDDPKRFIKRDGTETKVRPDIIVHRRRAQDSNLIVVEVKKHGGSLAEDVKKLRGYVGQFHYQHAFQLVVGGRSEKYRLSRIGGYPL